MTANPWRWSEQKLPEDTWVIRRDDGKELSLQAGAVAVSQFTAAPGHQFFVRSIAEQVAAHQGGQVVLIPADPIALLFNALAPVTSPRSN